MHDAPQPPVSDIRLLRSLRGEWLAALLSVLAAIAVLSAQGESAGQFDAPTHSRASASLHP